MEIITNLKIRRFVENIGDIINNSDLPIELIRLSLYMIYTETQRTADNVINQEINTEMSAHLQDTTESQYETKTIELTQDVLNTETTPKGDDVNAECKQS